MELKGQVALITGASRNPGLGISVAETLAAHGVRMMLTGGSNQAVLDANVAALRTSGTEVCGRLADVTDFGQVTSLVDEAVKQFGGVNMLIHCAGGRGAVSILDMKLEDWRRVVRTNLDGAFHLTKAVAPQMIELGGGRLIFMSGISGQAGDPDRSHVVTAKGGIMAFVKAAAFELGPHGITVNAISPGIIDTPRADGSGVEKRLKRVAESPLRRLGSRQDIANACLFLVSEKASFITGQTLSVNGGAFM